MLDFASRHNVAPQTEHFPMSDINEAFARLDSGKGGFGTADSTVGGSSQPKACTRTADGMGGGNSITRTARSTAKAPMRYQLNMIM